MVFHFLKHYLFSARAGAVVRSIAWICMFGIGISVAAMIIVLNVMNGFNEAIHKRLLSVDPHLSIEASQWSEAQETQKKLQDLKEFQGAKFFPSQEEDVIFRTIDALFSGAIARGLSAENLLLLQEKLAKPQQPEDAWKLQKGEVILGEDLAYSLGVFAGDDLTFVPPESMLLPPGEIPPYEKLKVKHIFRSEVSDIDSKYVLYETGKAFASFRDSLSRKTYLHVYLAHKDLLPLAKGRLEALGLKHQSWEEKNSSYLYALKMERVAMASFLGLTVVIASFTILMVLSLVISQKRKDIALLLTMGLSPKRTQSLFTNFGFHLGAYGAVMGFLLGILLCILLDRFSWFELPREIYYDYKVPVKIDYITSLAILFSSLLVSYLGASLPARIGAKLNLSRVLRPGVSE